MVQLLWKTVLAVFQEVKHILPYNPTILLKGIQPEELKIGTHTNTCTRMSTAALFTTAKEWKQPKRPSPDGWTDKLWHFPVT